VDLEFAPLFLCIGGTGAIPRENQQGFLLSAAISAAISPATLFFSKGGEKSKKSERPLNTSLGGAGPNVMQLHDGGQNDGQNDGRNDGIITHIACPHTCSKAHLSPTCAFWSFAVPPTTVVLAQALESLLCSAWGSAAWRGDFDEENVTSWQASWPALFKSALCRNIFVLQSESDSLTGQSQARAH
jgi:hypothetical protein